MSQRRGIKWNHAPRVRVELRDSPGGANGSINVAVVCNLRRWEPIVISLPRTYHGRRNRKLITVMAWRIRGAAETILRDYHQKPGRRFGWEAMA